MESYEFIQWSQSIKLIQIRKRLRLTKKDFATKLGVSIKTLYNIEEGLCRPYRKVTVETVETAIQRWGG